MTELYLTLITVFSFLNVIVAKCVGREAMPWVFAGGPVGLICLLRDYFAGDKKPAPSAKGIYLYRRSNRKLGYYLTFSTAIVSLCIGLAMIVNVQKQLQALHYETSYSYAPSHAPTSMYTMERLQSQETEVRFKADIHQSEYTLNIIRTPEPGWLKVNGEYVPIEEFKNYASETLDNSKVYLLYSDYENTFETAHTANNLLDELGFWCLPPDA